MVSGQWSVVSGQWSVVSGQWSVVSGLHVGGFGKVKGKLENSEIKKVLEDFDAVRCGEGLGVKLDSPYGKFAVLEGHYFIFWSISGNFETFRKRGTMKDERVVTCSGKW